MSSPLPYCRTNQTSSDVGMIGMITASARRNATGPSENSSMISRARVHAGTRKAASVRSLSKADIPARATDVRFWGQSGHDVDLMRCLLLTQSRHRRLTIIALQLDP
jgi:hypothetical protein